MGWHVRLLHGPVLVHDQAGPFEEVDPPLREPIDAGDGLGTDGAKKAPEVEGLTDHGQAVSGLEEVLLGAAVVCGGAGGGGTGRGGGKAASAADGRQAHVASGQLRRGCGLHERISRQQAVN